MLLFVTKMTGDCKIINLCLTLRFRLCAIRLNDNVPDATFELFSVVQNMWYTLK